MKRKIIQIDEAKCNGCGLCIPDCPEGALQLIDGKARLVSDLFCDGLGACMGTCPEGAITVVEREAEPYDETRVMENIVRQGRNTILAHLDHLRSHGEQGYLNEAIAYIRENNIDMSPEGYAAGNSVGAAAVFRGIRHARESLRPSGSCGSPGSPCSGGAAEGGCPGSQPSQLTATGRSRLENWPVQLHLLTPGVSFLRGADLILAADCVAFAMGDFHDRIIRGRPVAIACPKLDSNQESYLEKLTAIMVGDKINTLTVVVMEVPCCGGLIRLALAARERSGSDIPVKKITVSTRGEVIHESWM